MKKKLIITIAAVLLLLAGFFGWKLFGPTVKASKNKYFYIHSNARLEDVKDSLVKQGVIRSKTWFNMAAGMAGYKNVRPGRYEIKNGMSVLNLVRHLRNGQQSPVSFVITKIRTKEVLAARIGRVFECDSLDMISFLNNPDSLSEYGLDTANVIAAALPLTYTLKWNSSPSRIFNELYTAWKIFWTAERKQLADSLGLSPVEVSTLASIIDEETNAASDKPNIASVYLNRLRIGMPLQADPTVKFALQDFGLRRIYEKQLQTESPYNTYINKGLPPGPICTPATATIDSVLHAPRTDYVYFVASPAFDGTHLFSSKYQDHMILARKYQKELNNRKVK